MEACLATNEEAPLAARRPIPPPANQAPNDCAKSKKKKKTMRSTLQEADEGSKQYGEASFQGMERHSRAMNIRKVQAIH